MRRLLSPCAAHRRGGRAGAGGGCSLLPPTLGGTAEKPKPAELQANPNLIGVRQAWTAKVGTVDFPLVVTGQRQRRGHGLERRHGGRHRCHQRAANNGAARRAVRWPPASASTAGTAAVITRSNEVVAFASGKEVWRQKLNALSYTPPLVAGARVFVLGADRSVRAFDGGTGRRLWTQHARRAAGAAPGRRDAGRGRHAGGGAGRPAGGLNPLNGSVRWEAPIATAAASTTSSAWSTWSAA
jgi:hypothetical protein